MKLFSRVTNSFVMTAVFVAVIVGSLCFSVGEGLRLTPFTHTVVQQTEDSSPVVNVDDAAFSLSKYGPLDVPSQKRGKRSSIDVASAVAAGRELVAAAVVRVCSHQAVDLNSLPKLRHLSDRAPPLES
jgi:hypothetical protein